MSKEPMRATAGDYMATLATQILLRAGCDHVPVDARGLLLHVADMNHAVLDRKAYLAPINRWFHRDFADLDEFKREATFQEILDEFVTLDSVRQAIRRAEKIVEQNGKDGKASENYRGFTFYHDNPDVSVHEVVRLIFEVCEVR